MKNSAAAHKQSTAGINVGKTVLALVILVSAALLIPVGERAKASESPERELTGNPGDLSVYFEENRGQFPANVRYFARGASNYDLFLTATDAVYVLHEARQDSEMLTAGIGTPNEGRDHKATSVYMSLAGANENSTFVGQQTLQHRTNYFKGAESTWHTDIPNYQSVRMNGVYQGINVVWFGRTGGPQYDLVVQPDADPSQIEWEVTGADAVELDLNGDLVIKTEFGDIKHLKPYSYQEIDGVNSEVESRFVLENSRIRFELGNYDRSKPLVIDRSSSRTLAPSAGLSNLVYSSFLGGPGGDEGHSIEVDSAGNVYVVGVTSSPTFPTTPGSFDTAHNGAADVFVTKLNPNGSALVYSTFIGGSGNDLADHFAVDPAGNVFIGGRTVSTNFPTTSGAFDTTQNGIEDIFVMKLDPAGSALSYSTYLGGSSTDQSRSVAIDTAGNAYVAGQTFSTDFPTTAGVFDTTHNGSIDVVVAKLNPSGSALTYSTYIGGSSSDTGLAIALDAAGNAVVAGYTSQGTPNYPTTAGAFDTTHNGSFDQFITKLDSSGSSLIYSTFMGGNGVEIPQDIIIDGSGNAFIVGETESSNYPTTSGAFDTTYGGGIRDAYVTKLNSTGSALIYSTFMGGNQPDLASGIAIDALGDAFIAGWTESANFPTTAGAFDTTHNGGRDVVITHLNAAGSALIYSTFIGGGSFVDEGLGIAIDVSGNVYVTGRSANAAYPTTPGAFDTTHGGTGPDVIVSKLGEVAAPGGTAFDFDGDGRADLSVFRPGDQHWYINRSSNNQFLAVQFGISTDHLAAADYDGDSKTDIAVWREDLSNPDRANFYILQSSSGTVRFDQFGRSGDSPSVVGDWDGDGKADVAVYREGQGGGQSYFFYRPSSQPGTDFVPIPWGSGNDRPVRGDFDGDGRNDAALYRPTSGFWYILQSSNAQPRYESWGIPTDILAPADYDGDGKTDVGVFRNGDWYIKLTATGEFRTYSFGLAGDKPVPADYDGDGNDDIGVFRGGTWYINQSTAGFVGFNFGTATDRPVPAQED